MTSNAGIHVPEHVYAEGHLPGAVNIRPRRCDELAPTLLHNPEARIIVYCGSATCDASHRVAQRLHDLGYHNVHRYTAGKQDWVNTGLPLEHNTQHVTADSAEHNLEGNAGYGTGVGQVSNPA